MKIILKKMCDLVGADYYEIDFTEDRWYTKYSWTHKQEGEFKKWLADYLFNNVEARLELMVSGLRVKRHCDKAAIYFSFNYGWSLRKDEKDEHLVKGN